MVAYNEGVVKEDAPVASFLNRLTSAHPLVVSWLRSALSHTRGDIRLSMVCALLQEMERKIR
jgi:hypothetical protein